MNVNKLIEHGVYN